MRILLTGGTGFIGKNLSKELISCGHELTIVSRSKEKDTKNIKYIPWDKNLLQEAVNTSEIVINLAGEPIAGKRWTDEQKDLLYKSRIVTTQLIVNAINNATNKPKKLINASAIGYYGNRKDEKLTEDSSCGNDFLSALCKDWESEAKKAKTNVVILRTGIVLGKDGGALEKMLSPFKYFLGGTLGNGSQWMPWISLDDAVGLIQLAIENDSISGVINVVSPNPVTNKEFSNVLGKVLNKPSFLPAPALALKLLLGDMSGLLLGSQRVIPDKALQYGYKFKYFELEEFLRKTLITPQEVSV